MTDNSQNTDSRKIGLREWKKQGGMEFHRENVGRSGIPGIISCYTSTKPATAKKPWLVQLWYEGKMRTFGRYETIDEAIPALIEARRSLGVKDLYRGIPAGWDLV